MAENTETTIPPALTPEQWDEVRGRLDWQRDVGEGPGWLKTALSHWADGVRYAGVADPTHAAVAGANALLPDGDPGKITQAMVDRMRWTAETLAQHGWSKVRDEAAALARDADTLAALLPPCPPPNP